MSPPRSVPSSKKRHTRKPFAAICITWLLFQPTLFNTTNAYAQKSDISNATNPSETTPSAATLIPTPDTLSFTFRNYAIVSQWDVPGTSNLILLRIRAPLKIGGRNNYMRLSIPYLTKAAIGPGLADTEIFDVVLFDTSWGQWGIGPLAGLLVNRGEDRDTLQLGPVLEASVWVTNRWDIRILNRNYFDTQSAYTTTQVNIDYKLGKHWVLSPLDTEFPYDWTRKRFPFISLGILIGARTEIWGQDIRFALNPLFNPVRRPGGYKWSLTIGITFTFPTH